jgi:hypothetical protein
MNQEYLKLKPDYECYPIWKIGPNYVENLNPEELPITQILKNRLTAWQIKFDQTLDRSDPISSGFKSKLEVNDFDREGHEIWKKLIHEMGPDYQIKYFSVLDNKLYDSLDDVANWQ